MKSGYLQCFEGDHEKKDMHTLKLKDLGLRNDQSYN